MVAAPPSNSEVHPSTSAWPVLAAAVISSPGTAVGVIGASSGISQQPPNMKRSVQMPTGSPPFLTHSQTNMQTPRRPDRLEIHGDGRIWLWLEWLESAGAQSGGLA